MFGVNSFIGCYHCCPINATIRSCLSCHCPLILSNLCFTCCLHDSCSILPRNHEIILKNRSQTKHKPKTAKKLRSRKSQEARLENRKPSKKVIPPPPPMVCHYREPLSTVFQQSISHMMSHFSRFRKNFHEISIFP